MRKIILAVFMILALIALPLIGATYTWNDVQSGNIDCDTYAKDRADTKGEPERYTEFYDSCNKALQTKVDCEISCSNTGDQCINGCGETRSKGYVGCDYVSDCVDGVNKKYDICEADCTAIQGSCANSCKVSGQPVDVADKPKDSECEKLKQAVDAVVASVVKNYEDNSPLMEYIESTLSVKKENKKVANPHIAEMFAILFGERQGEVDFEATARAHELHKSVFGELFDAEYYNKDGGWKKKLYKDLSSGLQHDQEAEKKKISDLEDNCMKERFGKTLLRNLWETLALEENRALKELETAKNEILKSRQAAAAAAERLKPIVDLDTAIKDLWVVDFVKLGLAASRGLEHPADMVLFLSGIGYETVAGRIQKTIERGGTPEEAISAISEEYPSTFGAMTTLVLPFTNKDLMNNVWNSNLPFHEKAFITLGGGGNAAAFAASGGLAGVAGRVGAVGLDAAVFASQATDPNVGKGTVAIAAVGLLTGIPGLDEVSKLGKLSGSAKSLFEAAEEVQKGRKVIDGVIKAGNNEKALTEFLSEMIGKPRTRPKYLIGGDWDRIDSVLRNPDVTDKVFEIRNILGQRLSQSARTGLKEASGKLNPGEIEFAKHSLNYIRDVTDVEAMKFFGAVE